MKLSTLSNKVLPSKLQTIVAGSNGSGNNPIIYPKSNTTGKSLSTQQIAFVVGGNGSGNDPTKPQRQAIKVKDFGNFGG
ncbi:hypothetical protein CWB99_15830 [Pseudoalteromonas rubra]|uniref:Uncharacterized protein n=1 Tax=Pseudoalteromonas rubra TaxID=43658 RepID=A0A5S3WJB9_9GAMM|nr:hypothetical protein [Pseudoalteromonas rubra]TMP27186.1 hypothetical protein CWB99_15830 [Pseudoalteromonas rubra]TMP29482.1 hypothetical protein CWC00_18925 [Pseudoalteromonas rubra]